MSGAPWPGAVIIAITLIGVAVGRYPWLRMNRATIALVGTVAPIVAETAARHGLRLGVVEYLRCGVPVTLLTLLAGAAWLSAIG